jgi:hypothetical protein
MAKQPDKPEKYSIDILGIELEQNLPNWLSPAGKGDKSAVPAPKISEDRKQEIRDKHRARYLRSKT